MKQFWSIDPNCSCGQLKQLNGGGRYPKRCFGCKYKAKAPITELEFTPNKTSISELIDSANKLHINFELKFQGRERTRELVRIRDSHTCQSCGKLWSGGRRFDIHHLNDTLGIMTRCYDRLKDIDGLITLCHKCHLNLPESRNNMGNKSGNLDYQERMNSAIEEFMTTGNISRSARNHNISYNILWRRVSLSTDKS